VVASATEKSSRDTWLCSKVGGEWSPCRGRRNHPKKDSWRKEGRHTSRIGVFRSKYCPCTSPTILTGGLSSISVRCAKKTSRAAIRSVVISAFFRHTDFLIFPLYPTSSRRLIMSSMSGVRSLSPAVEVQIGKYRRR
jgi:hypothetical protein